MMATLNKWAISRNWQLQFPNSERPAHADGGLSRPTADADMLWIDIGWFCRGNLDDDRMRGYLGWLGSSCLWLSTWRETITGYTRRRTLSWIVRLGFDSPRLHCPRSIASMVAARLRK